MITVIMDKGSISIPVSLVEKLDIKTGMQIRWTIEGSNTLIGQVLPSRGKLARQIAGMGKTWLTSTETPVSELIKEREQEDQGC